MSSDEIKSVTPLEAQAIVENNKNALLIDVRSKVEFDYVGHPVDAVHIAWKDYPNWEENPAFVAEVNETLSRSGDDSLDRPLLMLCRSGARSMQAAERLREHGYTNLYNVEEGFEGDKDEQNHRGNLNGWRYHQLPWEQG